MSEWAGKLNKVSFRGFTKLFSSLTLESDARPAGTYRGHYLGPGWLRSSAGPALRISGLAGWWGKFFDEDNTAINLVLVKGKLEERLPMTLAEKNSKLDGRLALSLVYDPGNPFPWPLITDELRPLDDRSYLGMMVLPPGIPGKLAFPFLLEPYETAGSP